jgi:predicted  nucleic acid-binding Zn-ribbon protein
MDVDEAIMLVDRFPITKAEVILAAEVERLLSLLASPNAEISKIREELIVAKNEIYQLAGTVEDLTNELKAEKARADNLFDEAYNRRLQIDRLQAQEMTTRTTDLPLLHEYEIGINYRNEVTIYTASRSDAEIVFRWLCQNMNEGVI